MKASRCNCLCGWSSLCLARYRHPSYPVLTLTLSQADIFRVEVPKVFNEAHREMIQADPVVVDLHTLSPYFYDFGIEVVNFPIGDEAPSVADCLMAVLLYAQRSFPLLILMISFMLTLTRHW